MGVWQFKSSGHLPLFSCSWPFWTYNKNIRQKYQIRSLNQSVTFTRLWKCLPVSQYFYFVASQWPEQTESELLQEKVLLFIPHAVQKNTTANYQVNWIIHASTLLDPCTLLVSHNRYPVSPFLYTILMLLIWNKNSARQAMWTGTFPE